MVIYPGNTDLLLDWILDNLVGALSPHSDYAYSPYIRRVAVVVFGQSHHQGRQNSGPQVYSGLLSARKTPISIRY